MFRLSKPDARFLEEVRRRHRDLPLSYEAVGCSRAAAPAGFVVDHYREKLGDGAVVFAKARAALREWRMLRLGWVQPCWPDGLIKEGELVGTLAHVYGLWSVNVCRIVFVEDQEGTLARFGLAYGTLAGHPERGEESFRVEWDRNDDSVWFDIRAVSRPGHWLTRLAYPLTRRAQRRFGHDSQRTLSEAVR